ncbi:MAG: lipoyl(octanoyl) transferase LipB [Alphaproteobacteria bacterium]|nr:lipoyl(octanoyl) transferase LipB [Alphaproteobacteria bacterium]
MPRAAMIEWRISDKPVAYADAVAAMERRAAAVAEGRANELVWLLEHPPLYTAGTSAKDSDLLAPARFPVHATGRGGQFTYHGPGQRVGYVMMDLRQRDHDVRRFVRELEEWLIRTLAAFNVRGERRDGRVGIWVAQRNGKEHKIAALGIRVRRSITFHGISLNVDPDLEHFSGIVPCGIAEHGVTSLHALGLTPAMMDVDLALRSAFEEVFGATIDETAMPERALCPT